MARFPLSYGRVKKVWDGSQDPLDFLTPHEQKAAELYVSIAGTPKLNPGTLDKSKRVTFGRLFREHFGFDLTVEMKKSILRNPAWLAYVQHLQIKTKDTVMAKLEQGAMSALDRYQKAGELAEQASDHKEMRLWGADYLDRVGATRKVGAPPQAPGGITIVFKGRNFTEAEVLKQLPSVEAEIVQEEE